MDILKCFLDYAEDFEQTYKDDDWSRLTKHFNGDASYEIISETMPCVLNGPDAIFAGIKKSLDGFDRRYDNREIKVNDDRKIEENALSVSWAVTYTKADLPPFVLDGKSECSFKDGKIDKLADHYFPATEQALADWVKQTGFAVDPSYT